MGPGTHLETTDHHDPPRPSTPEENDIDAIELALPFAGRWIARNSPARRVPSHGTDMFGSRYAIDFVGVDERGRTATTSNWRTLLASEPPDIFVGFGRPILAPLDGEVVAVHDGEEDHAARRSQIALVPYMLGQTARIRRGAGDVAGNHVIISHRESNVLVAVVHLQAGSIRVAPGDIVSARKHIANCGNSGNSTEPHVHVQAMDRMDLSTARGVPIVFTSFREWERPGSGQSQIRRCAVPREEAVVESLAASAATDR